MFKPDTESNGTHEEPANPGEELAEFFNLPLGHDDHLDYEAESYEDEDEQDEDQDEEGPFESLLRCAEEIEAGLMPGWKLDRSQPGALLWTTPAGRKYKSTLDGSSYVLYRQ